MRYEAPEGYVYANKLDNSIYGKVIIIGINDSIDNWELILEPKEEENNITKIID